MPLTSKGAAGRAVYEPHDVGPIDERALAKAITGGDRRAFETAFRRHHRELYRYCRAILGNAHEAEDALQQTMVKALRALPGETREIALKPWLFRVAHNEAVGLLRARRSTVELDPEQADVRGGIEGQAETRERLRRLVGDLGQLPERQRGALIMRELNGIGFAEIGAAFGISEAAAKQTVYEARTSLHRMAEGRDMDCEPVREAISSDDRRRLRGRRIRAHLRECTGCRDFEASIAERRADLAVLAPPIALPAVLAALHAALAGAGGAAAGGGAAVGTGTIGAAAAAKSIAAVLATIAIAGGAAEVGGLVHFGGSGDARAGDPAETGRPATGRDPIGAPLSDTSPHPFVPPAGAAGVRPLDGEARARRRGPDRSTSRDHGSRGAAPADLAGGQDPPGQAATPPGQSLTPPGQEQVPPGQASTPPGQSEAPPGQSHTPPDQSQAADPPGQEQVPPGQSRIAPGQGGTPPGQADIDLAEQEPATSNGNAAGHSK